jgi:Xaa-Pro aminopeptidase
MGSIFIRTESLNHRVQAAGTLRCSDLVDLIRSSKKNVVSSADLIAQVEATWTEEQVRSHFAARDSIVAAVFPEVGRRVRNGGTNEFEIQQWLVEAFRRESLVADGPPIVAVNQNSSNPRYVPSAECFQPVAEGDVFLLDIWSKKNPPGAVYSDISWVG